MNAATQTLAQLEQARTMALRAEAAAPVAALSTEQLELVRQAEAARLGQASAPVATAAMSKPLAAVICFGIPALLLVLVIMWLSSLGGGGNTATGQTGSPLVYQRIDSTRSCTQLQREFDTAESNGHTDYMVAADRRMREVGCY